MRAGLAAAAVVLVVLGGFASAADAAGAVRPAVVSLSATPQRVTAAGGYVTVRARVRHARTCVFSGQQTVRRVPCGGGTARARLYVSANPGARAVMVTFRLTAQGGKGRVARKSVVVTEAAAKAPPPPPLSLAVDEAALPTGTVGAPYSAGFAASGGVAPYSWSVSAGSLPPGLALGGDGSLSGTPTEAGQWPFTVQAADAKGSVATAAFSLTVVAGAAPAAPTTVPTVGSSNWSGYVLSGGPYTGVTGTFNVPSIYASATDTATAEWVGIDGTSSSDPGIIQAGIAEDYQVATNTYAIEPWIELFPAPPFYLPLAVGADDQVTVTIDEIGTGSWNVLVQDDSNGQSYSTNQAYSGPATSAEWVVEAPTNGATNTVWPVGLFSPVTFTKLGVDPVSGALSRWVMLQGGAPVATPSDLSPTGFTVGAGGVTPAAP